MKRITKKEFMKYFWLSLPFIVMYILGLVLVGFKGITLVFAITALVLGFIVFCVDMSQR